MPLTSAEIAVISALGSSALTGGTSLGVIGLRERLRRRTADRELLAAAVTDMLALSMSLSLRADTMGNAMKVRSGLGEGLDVALRVRKPLDPLEFHDWIAQDMSPLNAAWSVVWARGDQELVQLANKLMSRCGDVITASTARTPAETAGAKARRFAAGERWTPEMLDDLGHARKAMAHAREQLAQYARGMLGLRPAQLFSPEPAGTADEPPTAQASITSDAATPAAEASAGPDGEQP
jgi:hypothetical protein